jgi:RNA polymerase sigma factor (sigma-70 family)
MNPDYADDARLVRRFQEGDQAAFGEIVERYDRRLRGMIRTLVFQDEEVDDVAQETWASVGASLGVFDPQLGTSLVSWIYLAARRRSIDYVRKKYRMTRLREKLEGEAAAAGPVFYEAQGAAHPMISERLCREFLRATFQGPSPPHQLLAFGFVKLLEWKPRHVAEQLSGVPFRQLTAQLRDAYQKVSAVPGALVGACLAPLADAMDARVEEVLGPLNEGNRTWTTYRHTKPALLARIVGDATFADFYTGAPEQNIVQWWDAVFRRVRKELLLSTTWEEPAPPQPAARVRESVLAPNL